MTLASLQRSGKMPVRKDILRSGKLKRIHYTLHMIRRLLILKTNFLDSADHCTDKVVVTPSMNSNVNH